MALFTVLNLHMVIAFFLRSFFVGQDFLVLDLYIYNSFICVVSEIMNKSETNNIGYEHLRMVTISQSKRSAEPES
jgi:hypothetical protein